MEALEPPLSFGPFKLFAKIDKGGMAEVYLGVHTQKKEFANELLAVKRLLPHLNANRPFINLLIHEAKIGVLLNHPSIASVYDLGNHKSEFFIALEYVHGKSLERILRRLREQNALDLISYDLSAFIILEILRALTFAHDLKDSQDRDLHIVHRDISPGNILLSYRGEIKLTDFGIATAEHRLQPGFTQVALGKIAYLSPEQAVNDPVARTSDLYSLGVIFFQLLTGQLPYVAQNSQSTIRRILAGNCASPREINSKISVGLSDLIMRSISRNPKNRFQNAAEFYRSVVEISQKDLGVDFSSKISRAYYQKKISDLLKSQFKSDLPSETEVLQRAIHSFIENNEASVNERHTVPQDAAGLETLRKSEQRLKDYFGEAADEKTIVLDDYGDEATRMGTLTASDRELLQPLAVASGGSHLPVRSQAAEVTRAANPDFPRIALNQKLKISSLEHTEREALASQLPKIEINSQASLDAFEESTLSSNDNEVPNFDIEPTKAMAKNEIIRKFPKTQEEERTVADKRAPLPQPVKKSPSRTSIKIKRSLKRWKWLFSSSLILLLLAIFYFFLGA